MLAGRLCYIWAKPGELFPFVYSINAMLSYTSWKQVDANGSDHQKLREFCPKNSSTLTGNIWIWGEIPTQRREEKAGVVCRKTTGAGVLGEVQDQLESDLSDEHNHRLFPSHTMARTLPSGYMWNQFVTQQTTNQRHRILTPFALAHLTHLPQISKFIWLGGEKKV